MFCEHHLYCQNFQMLTHLTHIRYAILSSSACLPIVSLVKIVPSSLFIYSVHLCSLCLIKLPKPAVVDLTVLLYPNSSCARCLLSFLRLDSSPAPWLTCNLCIVFCANKAYDLELYNLCTWSQSTTIIFPDIYILNV